MNGAAARLVTEGDKLIIASYANYDHADLDAYAPVVVHVDDEEPNSRHGLEPGGAAVMSSRPHRPLGRGPHADHGPEARRDEGGR